MIGALALGVAGAISLCWSAIGPVVLWSGETIESERVGEIGPQGFEVRMSFEPGEAVDARAFVAWGEVRRIENGWGEAAEYRAVADAVHRAEQRLGRGDSLGAGAVLEPISERYLNETGPTSSQIASVLIASNLFGGKTELALSAWFATVGDAPPVERAWIDPQTGLCPSLPPVFTQELGSRFVGLESVESADVTRRAMESLYRTAAAHAIGESVEFTQPEARAKADIGVRFVLDMVRAQIDRDPTARRAAREALERRARSGGPAWRAAWAGLGVGVSLMGEADAQTRDAGAARLVGVLVEHGSAAPGLAELARDLLVVYFEQTDRIEHAEAVRSMERAALLGLSPWRETDEDETAPGELGPGAEEIP